MCAYAFVYTARSCVHLYTYPGLCVSLPMSIRICVYVCLMYCQLHIHVCINIHIYISAYMYTFLGNFGFEFHGVLVLVFVVWEEHVLLVLASASHRPRHVCQLFLLGREQLLCPPQSDELGFLRASILGFQHLLVLNLHFIKLPCVQYEHVEEPLAVGGQVLRQGTWALRVLVGTVPAFVKRVAICGIAKPLGGQSFDLWCDEICHAGAGCRLLDLFGKMLILVM